MDIVVVDKLQNKEVVMDVAIPRNRDDIKNKEHQKLDKYQGLKEKVEKMWEVKVTVVPKSDISVQKSKGLGTARILCRNLKLPGL